MSNINKVLKTIKDKEIKFVDLRFTDTKGNGNTQLKQHQLLMTKLLKMV